VPRSTFVRQHPIDAEASWPGREYEQRAAEDGQILEEVIVLGDDLIPILSKSDSLGIPKSAAK
jgi:hypothetical protein